MKFDVVKLYADGSFAEDFLFGGENRSDGRPDVKYPASLQNFVIDTGSEVILVDTGLSPETPFKGYTKVYDYVAGLEALGYNKEQVTKILVTHKHPDHTGELKSFPNAKIYIGPEDADALKLTGDNIVRAAYSDGPYHNFPESQKIADGIYFIKARGHTNGNSIVFEDLAAARETLDRVREFIRNNTTVYLSTHTPEGVTNLEGKVIMTLE